MAAELPVELPEDEAELVEVEARCRDTLRAIEERRSRMPAVLERVSEELENWLSDLAKVLGSSFTKGNVVRGALVRSGEFWRRPSCEASWHMDWTLRRGDDGRPSAKFEASANYVVVEGEITSVQVIVSVVSRTIYESDFVEFGAEATRADFRRAMAQALWTVQDFFDGRAALWASRVRAVQRLVCFARGESETEKEAM